MLSDAAIVSGTFLVCVGTLSWVWKLWSENDPSKDSHFICLSLLIKGCVVPVLFWLFINSGWVNGLPPLMDISSVRGDWLAKMCRGITTILTCCGAVAAGWWLIVTYNGASSKSELRRVFRFWVVVALIPAMWLVYAVGPASTGAALLTIFLLCAWSAIPFLEIKGKTPFYAKAIARQKFGKFEDSEKEILSELEKKPDDYEGWMMLAELLATQFENLPEAESTIVELTSQPGLTPWQINNAWYSLANWYLKVDQNPEKAAHAFRKIEQAIPHTHFAKMAAVRRNNLPTHEELESSKVAPTIHIQTSNTRIGIQRSYHDLGDIEGDPDQVAEACKAAMEFNQDDYESMEQLIVIEVFHNKNSAAGFRLMLATMKRGKKPIVLVSRWMKMVVGFPLRNPEDKKALIELYRQMIQDHPKATFADTLEQEANRLEKELALTSSLPQ